MLAVRPEHFYKEMVGAFSEIPRLPGEMMYLVEKEEMEKRTKKKYKYQVVLSIIYPPSLPEDANDWQAGSSSDRLSTTSG